MRTNRWVSAACLTALASLSVSACGSTAGTASPTAALKGSTIAIGMMGVVTGQNESDTWVDVVGPAWQNWVNAQGGINGHPVKVYVGNSNNDPATAIAAVQNLVQNDHVVALVGDQDEQVDSAYTAYLQTAKIPVIGGEVATEFATDPYFFPTEAGSNAVAAIPRLVTSVGAKNVELVACSEVATCSEIASYLQSAVAGAGLTYSGTLEVAMDAPTYAATCISMKQANVDYAILSLNPESSAQLGSDCAGQGFTPWFQIPAQDAQWWMLGSTMQQSNLSMLMPSFPWWLSTTAVKAYRSAMTEYAGGTDGWQSEMATSTWAALELFRQAMAKAPAVVTSTTVLNALYKLHGETLGGLLPAPVTYVAGKANSSPACLWLGKQAIGKTAQATLTCFGS